MVVIDYGKSKMKLSQKFRIYPNVDQQLALAQLFGCCRFIYNLFLAENKARYEIYKVTQNKNDYPPIAQFDLINRLSQIKQSGQYPWLYDVCAQSLQQSVTHLTNAFKTSFKHKKGLPKFKKRSNEQKATFTNQTSIIYDDELKLGNISSYIKVNWDKRGIPDKYTGVTITKTPSNEYYASFIVEVEQKETNGQGIVGIDLGISTLATVSDGYKLENLRHYLKSQKKLARLQRQHSRKQKDSCNREKSRIKLARQHSHVANQRRDYIHKFTTRLIRENQAICIENLNVKGMVRNRKLAKHISTAGWGMLRQQLEYKAKLHTGCKLYIADRWYPSSQVCSNCDTKRDARLALKERQWTCPHCGTRHDRDLNAAKNLEKLAIKHHSNWKEAKESIVIL